MAFVGHPVLADIRKGYRLRPTQTVDKSKPVIQAEGESVPAVNRSPSPAAPPPPQQSLPPPPPPPATTLAPAAKRPSPSPKKSPSPQQNGHAKQQPQMDSAEARQKMLAQIRAGGVRLRHVQTADKSGLILDEDQQRQQRAQSRNDTPHSLDSQGKSPSPGSSAPSTALSPSPWHFSSANSSGDCSDLLLLRHCSASPSPPPYRPNPDPNMVRGGSYLQNGSNSMMDRQNLNTMPTTAQPTTVIMVGDEAATVDACRNNNGYDVVDEQQQQKPKSDFQFDEQEQLVKRQQEVAALADQRSASAKIVAFRKLQQRHQQASASGASSYCTLPRKTPASTMTRREWSPASTITRRERSPASTMKLREQTPASMTLREQTPASTMTRMPASASVQKSPASATIQKPLEPVSATWRPPSPSLARHQQQIMSTNYCSLPRHQNGSIQMLRAVPALAALAPGGAAGAIAMRAQSTERQAAQAQQFKHANQWPPVNTVAGGSKPVPQHHQRQHSLQPQQQSANASSSSFAAPNSNTRRTPSPPHRHPAPLHRSSSSSMAQFAPHPPPSPTSTPFRPFAQRVPLGSNRQHFERIRDRFAEAEKCNGGNVSPQPQRSAEALWKQAARERKLSGNKDLGGNPKFSGGQIATVFINGSSAISASVNAAHPLPPPLPASSPPAPARGTTIRLKTPPPPSLAVRRVPSPLFEDEDAIVQREIIRLKTPQNGVDLRNIQDLDGAQLAKLRADFKFAIDLDGDAEGGGKRLIRVVRR